MKELALEWTPPQLRNHARRKKSILNILFPRNIEWKHSIQNTSPVKHWTSLNPGLRVGNCDLLPPSNFSNTTVHL